MYIHIYAYKSTCMRINIHIYISIQMKLGV